MKDFKDIRPEDCVLYTGYQLKSLYNENKDRVILRFEYAIDGEYDHTIFDPADELIDNNLYLCYMYDAVEAGGLYIKQVAILGGRTNRDYKKWTMLYNFMDNVKTHMDDKKIAKENITEKEVDDVLEYINHGIEGIMKIK